MSKPLGSGGFNPVGTKYQLFSKKIIIGGSPYLDLDQCFRLKWERQSTTTKRKRLDFEPFVKCCQAHLAERVQILEEWLPGRPGHFEPDNGSGKVGTGSLSVISSTFCFSRRTLNVKCYKTTLPNNITDWQQVKVSIHLPNQTLNFGGTSKFWLNWRKGSEYM